MDETSEIYATKARKLVETADKLFGRFSPTDDDERFFVSLLEEFSDDIDVEAQLKLFHAWCLDQHPRIILNTRFRLRSWLVNNANYSRARRPQLAVAHQSKRQNPTN